MTTTAGSTALPYQFGEEESSMAGVPGANLAEQNKHLANMLAQARQTETLSFKVRALIGKIFGRASIEETSGRTPIEETSGR